jgi:phosphatidylglycerol---prolipoprotein diacylglyceryl transferase
VSFPVYIDVGPLHLHPHIVFELLAYAVGVQLYLRDRRRARDVIDAPARWSVVAAAIVGAAIGSKVLYWLEDPAATLAHWRDPLFLMGGKTIVGGLAGGFLAVELTKRYAGITRRTGDVFAVPLCIGIAIGRIGCFLSGLGDATYGTPSSLPWAIDFGDGIPRHPTQLYEVLFLLVLAATLRLRARRPYAEGDLFRVFLVGYMAFRLAVDGIKPQVRVIGDFSSIQLVALLTLAACGPDIVRWIRTWSLVVRDRSHVRGGAA